MKKIKDKIKKKLKYIKKYEIKRIFLKKMIYNQNININFRNLAKDQLNSLPKNSSKTRLINFCYITNQTKSVYRLSNMSRIKFKELILSGICTGITIK
jgi:small subunit ribosomal protein S14